MKMALMHPLEFALEDEEKEAEVDRKKGGVENATGGRKVKRKTSLKGKLKKYWSREKRK